MANATLRRRSIFSGLLLILLGVLFLMHNLRGAFPNLLELFDRWWPLLLILWGVAKLYDHLMARRTGQAAPRTITGGDIFLVFVVLALVGSVGMAEWLRSHGDIHEFHMPWEQTYSFSEELPVKAVPPDSRIAIRTERGDITVHPEDTAQIRVLVKKTASGPNESEAQDYARGVLVNIRETGDGFEVATQNQGGRTEVDLEVHLPRQARSVTARTERGGVQVSGITGSVTTLSLRGDVDIRNTLGDVSAQITRGDTHITGVGGNVKLSGRGGQVEVADVKGEAVVEGEFFGPVRFEKVAKGARFLSRRTDLTVSQLAGRIETGSGRLEISGAPGNVSLSTQKYDIALDNVAGRVQIDSRGGNVELRFPQPPREDVQVNNASGDIAVILPAQSTFEVHAETRRGDIDCDFSELASLARQEHGTARLEGKLGSKGPSLHLRTSYGSIRLHKTQ